MPATIQTIQKPTRARALDTSTSEQLVNENLIADSADWADTNGDGVANSWVGIGDNATFSIVTGNGFTGNAQRVAAGATENTYIYQSIPASKIDSYSKYKITFMQRNSHGIGVYPVQTDSDGSNNSGFENITTVNTGNATEHTIYFNSKTADGDLFLRFYVDSSAGDANSGEYIEVDTVEVQKIESFGNNNHGQIYSGRALEFDGVTDYLTGPNIADIVTGDATFACWVNGKNQLAGTSSDTWGVIWNLFESTSNGFGLLYRGNGKISVYDDSSGTDQGLTGGQSLYDNYLTNADLDTWHRAVVVLDNNEIKLYVNGVLSGSGVNILNHWNGNWNANLSLGIRHSSVSDESYAFHLEGMLSDFQIWNTAWTVDDALYDYNNPEQLALNRGGTSLTNSNLKLWYPMNDGHRGQQSYILDASNTGLGDEVLTNGDFSIGNVGDTTISGWNKRDTPTHYELSDDILFNGNKTLHISGGGTTNGARPIGTYIAGVTYKIDIWVYVVSGQMKSNPPDTPFLPGTQNIVYSTTTGEWENVVSYAVCDENATNTIDGWLIQVNGTSEFYIGSVSIKPVNDKNHATTVFYGDEQISSLWNRNFGGASEWTNRSSSNNWDTYDEAAATGATEGTYFTDNYLKLAVTSDGSNVKGAYLDGANWEDADGDGPAMVVGRTYRLSYSIEITAYTSGTLNIGFANASHSMSSNATKSYTATKTAATDYIDFVYEGTTNHAEILINASTSSAFTVYFDNFSIKEVGTATGWTDADQQLDIPQTALQSFNQLAWFDGVGDYTQLSDPYNHNLITVSAWIYLSEDNAEHKCWFANRDSADDGILATISGTEKVYVKFNGTTCTSSTTVSIGKWNHIVYTYDDAKMRLYINGEQDSTTTSFTASDISVTTNATIGKDSFQSTYYFPGCITEVSIWSTALNLTQINKLYNDGKAFDATDIYFNQTNLKGYFRNNGLSTWQDLTANDNDGTITASETMLITAGVDGSRDSQGFLMNRQKDTNSLNLYQNDTNVNGPSVQINTDGADGTTTGIYDSTGDGLGNFTIEFWFKVETSNGNSQILFQSAYQDGSDWIGLDINMDNSSGAINVIWYTEGGGNSSAATWATDTSSTYLDGNWHFFSASVDRKGTIHSSGTARCIMVIDKHCKSVVSGSTISDEASSIAFGRLITVGGRLPSNEGAGVSTTARYSFEGQLDDVRVYKEALTSYQSNGTIPGDGDEITSGQVLRNYNAGKRSHR